MGKRKKSGGKPNRQPKAANQRHSETPGDNPPVAPSQAALDAREVPKWMADEGNLYWRGRLILHLATHATAERDVLDEFQKRKWESPIPNPLPLEAIGDPTQARRNAIKNLNSHQGEHPAIHFSSVRPGLMAWCPQEYLSKN